MHEYQIGIFLAYAFTESEPHIIFTVSHLDVL
jgi:hypothetical protein